MGLTCAKKHKTLMSVVQFADKVVAVSQITVICGVLLLVGISVHVVILAQGCGTIRLSHRDRCAETPICALGLVVMMLPALSTLR